MFGGGTSTKTAFLWMLSILVVGLFGFLEGEQKTFSNMLQQMGDFKSPITIQFTVYTNGNNNTGSTSTTSRTSDNSDAITSENEAAMTTTTTIRREEEELDDKQFNTALVVAKDTTEDNTVTTTSTAATTEVISGNANKDLAPPLSAEEAAAPPEAAATKFVPTPTNTKRTGRGWKKRGNNNAGNQQLQQQQQQQQQGENNHNNLPPIHPSIREALKPDDRPCGSAERRGLAMRGEAASEEEWEQMTYCLIEQDMLNRTGQFIQHISKSGGSSMNAVMRRNTCRADRDGDIGFATLWYKPERLKRYHKIEFQNYYAVTDVVLTQGTTCEIMHQQMKQHHQYAITSEGVVPFDNSTQPTTTTTLAAKNDPGLQTQNHIGVRGGCPTTLNSIIFREPLRRLESHYRHMHEVGRFGTRGKDEYLQHGVPTKKFDVHWMLRSFDIISDNYYTRHLTGHGYFAWEPTTEEDHDETKQIVGPKSLAEHPDAWTKIFPMANASLHNMDWVALLNSDRTNENNETEIIIKYGLGMEKYHLGHARAGTPNGKPTDATDAATITDLQQQHESLLSDPEYMKQINVLDYKLWEEAQKLNRLDLYSIQRMEPYYEKAIEKARSKIPEPKKKYMCCGRVCMKKYLVNNPS